MHTAAIFAFLDPDHLAMFGPWAIAIVCAVVFAETGLLIGFVFPGDTLLIVTGLLTQSDKLHLPIWVAAPAIAIAAFLGGELGYYIGRRVGPRIFERRDSGIFSKAQVDRTNAFFDRYGAGAVILARFVPVVRTFAPIAAGVGHMDYRKYSLYNVIGAVAWGFGITFLGYVIGFIPPVRHFVIEYIDLILLAAVAVTVIPTIIHLLRNHWSAKRSAGHAPAD
ncbi:DedA family protein [uncultured Amnibacterium sp.]|uniref:DedA family protein n=1 Tax=uncultured Amnibacterium sp. TaxID=1631851 RepID=UPI0035CBAF9F